MGMQVKIQDNYESDRIKIFVSQGEGSDRRTVKYVGNGQMEISIRSVIPEIIAPFLELPREFFDDFLKALLKHADEKGIKPENQTLIEGKFEAQSKHLEDMREILLGKSKITIERKP